MFRKFSFVGGESCRRLETNPIRDASVKENLLLPHPGLIIAGDQQ